MYDTRTLATLNSGRRDDTRTNAQVAQAVMDALGDRVDGDDALGNIGRLARAIRSQPMAH